MKNSRKAFTIIELMTVIVILGIISSMAVPSYVTVRARTQQEKMKSTLSLIARYEELHFIENDYYAPGSPGVNSYTFEIFHDGRTSPDGVNLSDLPFVLPDNRNYDYRIYWVNNEEEHYFYAEGIASVGRGNDIDGDAKMDQWQVSSYNMQPIALSDDLGRATAEGSEGDDSDGEGDSDGGGSDEGGSDNGEGSDGEGPDDGDSDGEDKGKDKDKDKEKDKGKGKGKWKWW
jgi:prepilin-type N-terminal cleavage/methylation domain-containing protein